MINQIENFPLPNPPLCDSTNKDINIYIPKSTKGITGIDFFPPNNADLILKSPPIPLKNILRNARYNISNIPETFTWRNGQYDILEPPDQGACGSCWAVSSTSALSDRFAIKYKIPNPRLSAANTLTCASTFDYTEGCKNGGSPFYAGQFFENTGVKTETCFPYIFGNQPTESSPCLSTLKEGCCMACCSQDKSDSPDYWDVYKAVPGSTKCLYTWNGNIGQFEGTILAIQQEILADGPIVTGFIVYTDFFDWYTNEAPKGSIYIHDPSKSTMEGAHAVVIVGWGVGPDPRDPTKNIRYWDLRNSWGTISGDKGYFKTAFSDDIPEESKIGIDLPVYFRDLGMYGGGAVTFLPDALPTRVTQPPTIQPPIQLPASSSNITLIIVFCALGVIAIFLFYFFIYR